MEQFQEGKAEKQLFLDLVLAFLPVLLSCFTSDHTRHPTMASIPLASTSRAVFAPASSSSSRMLRRQLLVQAGYAASRPISSSSTSTSTVQSRRQHKQLQASHCQVYQACRHSSSTGKGMGSRTLAEESHVNPSTGLGGSNTEQSFFSRSTTNAGGAGKSLATTPLNKVDARHAGNTSGTSETNWIAKQLEMMERRDNMKNEAPIKVGSRHHEYDGHLQRDVPLYESGDHFFNSTDCSFFAPSKIGTRMKPNRPMKICHLVSFYFSHSEMACIRACTDNASCSL